MQSGKIVRMIVRKKIHFFVGLHYKISVINDGMGQLRHPSTIK
jgi:hypothetical protein